MERAPRPQGLPPELGVAALVVAAALPLGRLYRPGSLWSLVAGAIVVSLAVAWVLERFRVPLPLSALGSAAAFTWFAVAVFFRSSMFGPFPSVSSFGLLWHALGAGYRSATVEVAPVAPTAELLLLAALGVWSTVWLVHDAAVRLRYPVLACGLALPLFVFPGTIVRAPGQRHLAEGAIFLAASLAIIFGDQRARLHLWGPRAAGGRAGWRTSAAVRLGVIGAILALAIAPVLPGYGSPPGLRGVGGRNPRVVYNPIVSIRPSLNSTPVRLLASVSSPLPLYLRLTSLDLFDGQIWTARPERATIPVGDGRVPASVPGASAREVLQRVTIYDLGGPWLPAAPEPVEVSGVPGAAALPEARSVVVPGTLFPGLRYEVVSQVPEPTGAELDVPIDYDLSPRLSRYRALPKSIPRRVRRIANEIAGEAPTPYRKAIALQEHLRSFTYDERVAAGHGFRDIVQFLDETRRGYCEQFAGSMAVLARALGIPARVAVGFGVGEEVGPQLYRLTTRHAHAWTEIYFPGSGWLAFEPTPRGGVARVPPYTRTGAAPTAPLASGSASPSPSASPSATASGSARPGTEGDLGGAAGGRAPIPAWILAPGVPALALLGLLVASRGRRLIRRRRARDARAQVATRYLDFLDWCAAAGFGRRPAETPAEHALRVGAGDGPAVGAVARLAGLAADALWAPGDGFDLGEAARLETGARRELARGLGTMRRGAVAIGWGFWRTDPRGTTIRGPSGLPGPPRLPVRTP